MLPNVTYDRKYFSFQRVRMILSEVCMEKDMSINEILLIGLMHLAKHYSDANKYFHLFNILSRRFNIAAKVMSQASHMLGKFHRRPCALRDKE